MKSTFGSLAAAGLLTAMLSGCGLADVGASAAAEGESAAEQVKEGKKLEKKVEQQVLDTQKQERATRDAAEQANQ